MFYKNISCRYWILLAVTITATDMSLAQTFTNTPNDTVQLSGMMEDLQTLTIFQLNTSANTITLGWEKISASVPANWEASVCDNVVCYTVLEDSGTMNPVMPDDSGFLLLHIAGHVNYGTAVIRYAVWDINFPALRDTLTYMMTVDQASGMGKMPNDRAFTVFPNPGHNEFNIVSDLPAAYTYSIIALTGGEIQTGNSSGNPVSVSTEYLPVGIYILQINSGNTFHTQKIIKQ